MIIHNIDQRSEDWFKIRMFKMTASHAQEIGNIGKGLETYCKQLIMEGLYPLTVENYTNENIEKGVELEASARDMYSFETGLEVKEVGFCELDESAGASPDGFVEDEGLIEIKCPSNKVFFDYLLDGKIDTKYEWQMQMQMFVCERKWCDYVVYNPNFGEKCMIIKRVSRDEEKITRIKEGLAKGKEIMLKLIEEIKG
jgi:exodeoxyribonuclease (lambda-induced)